MNEFRVVLPTAVPFWQKKVMIIVRMTGWKYDETVPKKKRVDVVVWEAIAARWIFQ